MSAIASNKRAYFDYEILETYEAGIELRGFEVKAIKSGRINLAGSYAVIRNNQVWLLNADIPPYQPKNTPTDYDSKRTRRLLLKKSEVNSLMGRAQEAGLTLVPLKVYIKNRASTSSGQAASTGSTSSPRAGSAHGRIKIELGLGKSKKAKDKREALKKRAIQREIERNL